MQIYTYNLQDTKGSNSKANLFNHILKKFKNNWMNTYNIMSGFIFVSCDTLDPGTVITL